MNRSMTRTCAPLIAIVVTLFTACATVGRDFPDAKVAQITIGETTQTQVREMFGAPWRVGIEDGQRTWTYGRYKYRLFGHSNTKDLVIRFDDDLVVSSYTFNTTEHEETQ